MTFSPAFSPAFSGGSVTPPGTTRKQLIWPESQRQGPFVYQGEGAHQLWSRRGRSPQWPDSIIVTADGQVVVRPNPTFGTPQSPLSPHSDVTVLIGGRDYRYIDTDPIYLALVAAGYEFRDVEDRP